MDPQNPNILYASFWGDDIYKSTDGGKHWATAMNGLPTLLQRRQPDPLVDRASRTRSARAPVLYVGFDVSTTRATTSRPRSGSRPTRRPAGRPLPVTGFNGSDDSVLDYCGGQCFYDNVIEVDPTNTDVVYAAGQFNYGIGSGGIFRSDDGGQTWKNLGWDLHPDFHAFAFDPGEPGQHPDRHRRRRLVQRGPRRPPARAPATRATSDGRRLDRRSTASASQITQFTSIATNPTLPARFWGGTQDNGTVRKSAASNTVVRPGQRRRRPGARRPDGLQLRLRHLLRHLARTADTDGGGAFFTATRSSPAGSTSTTGPSSTSRSCMNQGNPNQLFLGTYRLYRTDNAKATKAGDVHWNAISGDLTGGCTGTAPNGARTCALSAIGVGGGTASTSAPSTAGSGSARTRRSATPRPGPRSASTSSRTGRSRPSRSTARTSGSPTLAYNGFNQATPGQPGHVFKTTDGGKHWQDISGNLPDVPVNSLVLDPSYPEHPVRRHGRRPVRDLQRRRDWGNMGTGFPIVVDRGPGPRHRCTARSRPAPTVAARSR